MPTADLMTPEQIAKMRSDHRTKLGLEVDWEAVDAALSEHMKSGRRPELLARARKSDPHRYAQANAKAMVPVRKARKLAEKERVEEALDREAAASQRLAKQQATQESALQAMVDKRLRALGVAPEATP